MDIVLNIQPMAKPRMTRSDRWKERPVILKYWDFCNRLKHESKKHGYVMPESISLTFVIAMPKSWSKKKMNDYDGQKHQPKPDLDNLIKAFKDALAINDSYVWEYGRMRKIWGHEGKIIIHS